MHVPRYVHILEHTGWYMHYKHIPVEACTLSLFMLDWFKRTERNTDPESRPPTFTTS